jgi:threonine dehydrogenase-like Zn-dependent dehydrogenase
MKALAVFTKTREIRIVDHEAPKVTSPNDVKVRILEVGICGTDREICAFEYGTPPAGSDYLVIGHESLGEVVETGAEVNRVKPGDLVVPMVRRPCPHDDCLSCRSDRQDFCFTGDFKERGIKEAHGFLTELVVDHEKYMIPVPGTLREVGVLVEPLTIAEKALLQTWRIQERLPWECRIPSVSEGDSPAERGRHFCHRAVVLGAGPVGLLGAMCLVTAGFDTYVYSRSPAPNPKASLVESLGATYVSSQEISVEELARRVGNIDLVYEAVGASKVSFDLMAVLGTNGVFVFTGVPGRKSPVEVDTDRIMSNLVLKNQIVFGTVNADQAAFEAAISDLGTFMERWPDAVRSLITGRYTMEDYSDLLLGKAGGIKQVIEIGQE